MHCLYTKGVWPTAPILTASCQPRATSIEIIRRIRIKVPEAQGVTWLPWRRCLRDQVRKKYGRSIEWHRSRLLKDFSILFTLFTQLRSCLDCYTWLQQSWVNFTNIKTCVNLVTVFVGVILYFFQENTQSNKVNPRSDSNDLFVRS